MDGAEDGYADERRIDALNIVGEGRARGGAMERGGSKHVLHLEILVSCAHCERACGVNQGTRGIDARKQRQRGDREAAADRDRDEDGDGERYRDGFRRLSCTWRASSSSSVLGDFFGAPT